MNQHIDEKYFEDMRFDGLLLVDTEARKFGVIDNNCGLVVLVGVDDDSFSMTLNPEEIDAVCASLQYHKRKAIATSNRLEAEYETFTAIQRAIGL